MKVNTYTTLNALRYEITMHKVAYTVEFSQAGPMLWNYLITARRQTVATGTVSVRTTYEVPTLTAAINRITDYRQQQHKPKQITQ